MKLRLGIIILTLMSLFAVSVAAPMAVSAVGPHGCLADADHMVGVVGDSFYDGDHLCVYGGGTLAEDNDWSNNGVANSGGVGGLKSVHLWRTPGTCFKFYAFDGVYYTGQYMSFQITSSTYGNRINLASFLQDDPYNSSRVVENSPC